MGCSLESSRLEVMVEDYCNARYVANIIIRRIVQCTREVCLKSIVLKRCRKLGMFIIVFLRLMHMWTIGRWITRDLSMRWTIRFLIKLFIF